MFSSAVQIIAKSFFDGLFMMFVFPTEQVCPDTSEVIAVVFVLIRARPPKDPHKHTHGVRYISVCCQGSHKPKFSGVQGPLQILGGPNRFSEGLKETFKGTFRNTSD